jgi:hypothetical protein
LYKAALARDDFGTLRAFARLSLCSPPPARLFLSTLHDGRLARQLLACLLGEGCGAAILSALDPLAMADAAEEADADERAEYSCEEDRPEASLRSLRAWVTEGVTSRRLQAQVRVSVLRVGAGS